MFLPLSASERGPGGEASPAQSQYVMPITQGTLFGMK